MKIQRKTFEIACEGLHNTTIVAIKDVGQVVTMHGTKDFMTVTLQMNDQKDADKLPVTLRQNYTKSVEPKAAFTKLLNGLGITPDNNFDTDQLIGMKVQIVVQHRKDHNGKIHANISHVVAKRKPQYLNDAASVNAEGRTS